MKKEILCAAHQILEACKFLRDSNLVIGTWGNVSCRLEDDEFLLTPSALDYDDMTPEDLVSVSVRSGQRLMGNRVPSSEKEVHRLIYLSRSDVRFIIHDHSPYASAVAALGTEIPVVNEEMAQVFGGPIPCTAEYIAAGKHNDLGKAAAQAIGGSARGVLLKNHGLVVCGGNFKECKNMCLIAEKAAKIYLHIRNAEYFVISEGDCRSEHERFLYRYGTEGDK